MKRLCKVFDVSPISFLTIVCVLALLAGVFIPNEARPAETAVKSTPFGYRIVQDKVTGWTELNKFGRNEAVGASEEPVWGQSNDYTYITVADTLYISSTNAADDQTYEIQGLDASWNYQTATATVNGLTFVEVTGVTWMRVFRVKNTGTTDNAGVIYVHIDDADGDANGIPDTVASDTKARIDIGMNQTLMAIWTVPAGREFYLEYFYASTNVATKATAVFLRARPTGGVFQVKNVLDINGSAAERRYVLPLKFAEKTDIEVTATAAAGGGLVSAGFGGWFQPVDR